MAKFTKELADLGYPTTTIGYIACFAPGKLGKTAYCNLIAGKEIKTDYNLERAKYFWMQHELNLTIPLSLKDT